MVSYDAARQDAINEVYPNHNGTVTAAGVVKDASGDEDGMMVRLTRTGTYDTTFDLDGKLTDSQHATGNDGYADLEAGPDGTLYGGGWAQNAGSGSPQITKFASTPIDDYLDNGTADFDTVGSFDAFGACLKSVGGTATNQWALGGACPTSDGAFWNDVPIAADKVAFATAPGTTYTATVRFGARTLLNQPPGTYVAPVTFEVLAPNA
jgi:hypothetical protein